MSKSPAAEGSVLQSGYWATVVWPGRDVTTRRVMVLLAREHEAARIAGMSATISTPSERHTTDNRRHDKNQRIGGVPYFANARRFVPNCTVSFICVVDRISDVRQRILSLSQSVRCPQREQAITVPIRNDERNARGLPKRIGERNHRWQCGQ